MPFVDSDNIGIIEETKTIEKFNFNERDIIKDVIEKQGFSVIVTTPDKLILDSRNEICCKRSYCSSYNKKCYCPPYSLSLKQFDELRQKYKYCIIIISVVSPEEWSYVLKGNEFDEKKHKVYFRRWVQNITWGIYRKKLYPIFRDTDSYLLFGTSVSRCNKCREMKKGEYINNKCKTGIAWSSPEAVGVNIGKTLEQFNFSLKFGVTYDITRVATILTNENIHYNEYINIIKVPKYKQTFMSLKEMVNFMSKEIEDKVYILKTKTKHITVNQWKELNGKKVDNIDWKLWDYFIIFECNYKGYGKGRERNIEKIKEIAFMNNFPYVVIIDEIFNRVECDFLKPNTPFGVALI